ncbi:MAG: RnfABCDGE type electron transport complex subunit D [Planctomycetota bacterium]
MAKTGLNRNVFLRQPIMRKVIAAMVPCVLGGVYYFGWRSLANVLVAWTVCFGTEFIFCRKRKEPVSEAAFVTATILAIILPPGVPWHVLIIACVVSIMFAKEVFGGWARNIFNPAMAGRCFVYICFPIALTSMWTRPAEGLTGALDRWSTAAQPNAVTIASPVGLLKQGKLVPRGSKEPFAGKSIPFRIEDGQQQYVRKTSLLKALILGRISGSMGVTNVILICLGGLYLFYKKIASRSIILSVIISYAVLNELLSMLSVPGFYGAGIALCSGGFLFGAFFMATDPVSAPKTEVGKIMYGLIISAATTVIKNFSIFTGGFMFSLLLANMFAPILDYAVKSFSKHTKALKPERKAAG